MVECGQKWLKISAVLHASLMMFCNAKNISNFLLVFKVSTTRGSHNVTLGSNVTEEIEVISFGVTQLRMNPNFIRWVSKCKTKVNKSG